MSVINNVLKDLQNRESRFSPIDIGPVNVDAPSPRSFAPLLPVSLLALCVAVFGWVYLQQRGAGIEAAPSLPQESASVEPSDQAAVEPVGAREIDGSGERPDADHEQENGVAAADANQIIGLQIREGEREMRMEFALRDKVVAYLKQRGENSFAYHLGDIESRIAAPRISDNRWIRSLRIEPFGEGVDIVFETAPRMLVETRLEQRESESVWVIKLKNLALPENAEAGTPASATAFATATPAGDGSNTYSSSQVAESGPSEPTPTASQISPDTAQAKPAVKLEIRSTNPGAKSINRLDYALQLIESGRYGDAENLLRELIGGTEDYAARRQLMAFYRGRENDSQFAILARDSTLRYPEDRLFKTEYARVLMQQSSFRSVIRLLAGETDLDADQHSLLAASFQRLDQHDDAVRHYRLALQLDAANPRNWIALGISQEQDAALEDALLSYRQAIRLGGLNPRLLAFVEQRSDNLAKVLE